ncbi:hypothetical protein AAG570_012017 [Ranatra chinensis]|uniref:Uncharacterized protein n=1 Tax=Ranatra chinensis TaxID=642074 RepID=A0ABD0YHW3_9HEMI
MAKTADPGLHLYRELEGDPIQKVFLEGANDLADEDVPSAGERTARFGWWWEPVTVTRVATAPALARTDPSQVVTFSVRGCRPTVMPFNLPPCPTKSLPEEQPPQTSTVPGSEKPVGDDDPGITDSQNDV